MKKAARNAMKCIAGGLMMEGRRKRKYQSKFTSNVRDT